MSMTYYIYKITNSFDGKFYIGKTNDLEKRWYNHVYCALVKKEPYYFYNAIRKYGAEFFISEIIEECESDEQALLREKYWIFFLKSNNSEIGYNMTDGGDGVSGLKRTDESKNKQRAQMLGRRHSDETKSKMSKSAIGKIKSDETKQKMSKAKSGENNGMFGVSHRYDTKQKLSVFQSNRIRDPLTEEHKQKNREAALKQDFSFRIPIQIKNEIVSLYSSGNYTKRQLSEKFGLKYNSVVKIIRTHNLT